MSILTLYKTLLTIAQHEFADIVVAGQIMSLSTGDPLKLRLDIVDNSFVDVFVSHSGRYSYHWERRLTPAGDLYRHDNAPHQRWNAIATFPQHFHDGSEQNVAASTINLNPEQALREFLIFARRKLLSS